MADDDLWDDNTRQRLKNVADKHRGFGTRTPRPDPLVAPPTTAEAVADSMIGSGASEGPPKERAAPMAGHADSAQRRR